MKTCPNCGAKMEADVNFCTSCGTDIRNVPLDSVQNVEPESVVSDPSELERRTYRAAQNAESQASQALGKVSEAVKNFDKESLWKWFVTSWKTPSADQHGEKWYGIAVLLLEMILFAWSMSAGIKKIVYTSIPMNLPKFAQEKIDSFIHGLGFDVFFLVLIIGAGVIVGSYVAHKFVYNEVPQIFEYINKIVQLSNINVFVVLVLAFLFELKSGLMRIGGRQQTPNIDQIDDFYRRNIVEAYEQLKNSAKDYQGTKPVIKIFLLYEFSNNTQLIMSSIPEIFDNDKECYIMSIQDLEMFLPTYKKERGKFNRVVEEMLNGNIREAEYKCVLSILNDQQATKNFHFVKEKD